MLAACGTPKKPVVSNQSQIPSSSEQLNGKTFTELVAEMVETKSYTVQKFYQVVGSNDQRTDMTVGISKQFGPKAMAQYDSDDGSFLNGEIINLNQGIFSYSKNNGEFVLGDFDKLSGDKDIDDFYYTPLTFLDLSNWYKKNDGVTYETMDPDAMSAISTVSGLTNMANTLMIAFDFISAKATVENNVITILMDAYFDIEMAPVAAAKVVISDIGTTKDEAVENYLKNPREVAPATTWSETQLVTINEYFGADKAIELPFPNRASYAISAVGQPTYQEVMIRDYLSGDIRSSYGAQLLRAGFENITEEGDTANVYEKEVEDANGLSTFTVYVSYSSNAKLVEDYGVNVASLYPNGLFQIEAVYSYSLTGVTNGSIAQVDGWVSNHFASNAFPSLATAFSNASKASIQDDTAGYNAYFRQSLGISFDYFDRVATSKIYIESEDDAKAAIADYLVLVKANGFVNQDQKSTDFSKGYYFGDAGKTFGIQVDLAYKKDGAYDGAVMISFLDYSEVASAALGED